MSIEWPASLPNYVLVDGYTELMPDNTLHSKMEIGPPKSRRRSTAGIQLFAAKIYLDAATAASFSDFYQTTLADGTLSFDWEHPRTGATVTMRFMGPPVLTAVGGVNYYAQMNMGILP